MIYISVPSARLGYIELYSAHYNPDLHLLSFFPLIHAISMFPLSFVPPPSCIPLPRLHMTSPISLSFTSLFLVLHIPLSSFLSPLFCVVSSSSFLQFFLPWFRWFLPIIPYSHTHLLPLVHEFSASLSQRISFVPSLIPFLNSSFRSPYSILTSFIHSSPVPCLLFFLPGMHHLTALFRLVLRYISSPLPSFCLIRIAFLPVFPPASSPVSPVFHPLITFERYSSYLVLISLFSFPLSPCLSLFNHP